MINKKKVILTNYEELPQSFKDAYNELKDKKNPPKWIQDIRLDNILGR